MYMLRMFKQLFKTKRINHSKKCYSTLEPEYLQHVSTQLPTYDMLNVQIKGYDYPILENYQRFIHKLAENIGIEVEESWAAPPQNLLIKKLKQDSAALDTEYKLTMFERNVQIVDLPSTIAPIFFYAIQESLPEGVKVKVLPHHEEYEEIRYVPDIQLLELKSQLETLGGPSKKKS